MKKILLILTVLASFLIANPVQADPPRSDAEIAIIAKKCGVSFKAAKNLLAAGFHYNPADNSFEGGAWNQDKTDAQRAEDFVRAKARNFEPQWTYVADFGNIWLRDADGGARLYHYDVMRTMTIAPHRHRTQVRLDNGSWIWIRKDF